MSLIEIPCMGKYSFAMMGVIENGKLNVINLDQDGLGTQNPEQDVRRE